MNFKVWFLVLCFSLFPADPANAVVTADDINTLAESSRQTTDNFMQSSFKLRMAYEFSGRFLNPNDKNNLHELAGLAGDKLGVIAKQQKKLKEQIENYTGSDWEARYGSNGLWRKLSSDLTGTIISKCEIDFYLALTSDPSQRNKILLRILDAAKPTKSGYYPAYLQFLRAKSFSLLSQTDPKYKTSTKKEFNILRERSDTSHSTVFKIAIERIKLFGENEIHDLSTLSKSLAKSDCANDLELVLPLAFMQRRYDQRGFEETIHTFPHTEGFVGSLILAQLNNQIEAGELTKQNLNQISIFEAELAAQAAWRTNAENYIVILEHLSDTERFQTPLILYAYATAIADVSPEKSIRLLIKAAHLQQRQSNSRLDLDATTIAEQAAQLGYNLFIKERTNYRTALEAFENYFAIAEGEKANDQLEYLYTIVLRDCGQVDKSMEILKTIADRPTGKWPNRARLDLIILTVPHEKAKEQCRKQLENLIAEADSAIKTEAEILYCRLLLESGQSNSGEKVLTILTESKIAQDDSLNTLKSKAFQQLGKFNDAANCLISLIDTGNCNCADEALELTGRIVDRIDQLKHKDGDFAARFANYKKIAQYAYTCLGGQQAGLFLAEISIVAADSDKQKLSEIEKLLSDLIRSCQLENIDLLRCRARLLANQGQFQQSAVLWAKICSATQNEPAAAGRRNPKWWRAKFYELYCWSKQPQTKKQDLLHTIEILKNTYSVIPQFWSKKINSLK